LWFLSFVPYLFVAPRYPLISSTVKIALSVIPATAMAFGASVIGMQENNGVGVTWGNCGQRNNIDDAFTFLSVIFMLLFDAVLFFGLAWYIEQIFPGDFGVKQPWYFPCRPAYWGFCRSASARKPAMFSSLSTLAHQQQPTNMFEPDPPLPVALSLQNLSKVRFFWGLFYRCFYSNSCLVQSFGKVNAVQDVNLNVFSGQITALLGENGGACQCFILFVANYFLTFLRSWQNYGLEHDCWAGKANTGCYFCGRC
jgi:ATP-binding cassette subfamily A (ABC1) protein 3